MKLRIALAIPCRVLRFTLAVVATVGMAAPTTVRATPIVYELSGVTANFGSGTVTLSGTFTYDPVTTIKSAADITLSGGSFPLDGEYNNKSFFSLATGNTILAYDGSNDRLVFIAPTNIFDAPVTGFTFRVEVPPTYPADIYLVGSTNYTANDASPTGSLDPVPVPSRPRSSCSARPSLASALFAAASARWPDRNNRIS